jgi:hypothetical protein
VIPVCANFDPATVEFEDGSSGGRHRSPGPILEQPIQRVRVHDVVQNALVGEAVAVGDFGYGLDDCSGDV